MTFAHRLILQFAQANVYPPALCRLFVPLFYYVLVNCVSSALVVGYPNLAFTASEVCEIFSYNAVGIRIEILIFNFAANMVI